MNLHNLSPSEFDAKLKEHLIDSSVPFDPESWNKMNQKLDVAFPGKDSSRNGIYGLLIIALLVSSLFFWNLHTFSKQSIESAGFVGTDSESAFIESSAQSLTDQQNSRSTETPTTSDTNGFQAKETENYQVSDPKQSPSGGTADGTISGNKPSDPSSTVDHSTTLTSSKLADNPGSGSTDSAQKRSLQEAKNTSLPVVALQSTQNSGAVNTSTSVNTSEGLSALTNQAERNQQNLSAISSIRPAGDAQDGIGFPDSISKQSVAEVSPVLTQPMTSRWMLGFGYAPDISLVGFGETTSPGLNLGVMAEYQLNRRFSINSGIAYSKKKYLAAGDDYHPPAGFWDYGEVPDYTEAVCEVIEIPLNLRYYLRPTKANRVFFSTGLSSYLMLTEDYSYEYEGYYDPDRLDSWSVENENQHFLSIYNFSVGYQRGLGARWFAEIEPFIKAPLGGVGFGEVDLWSTGSYFSIKYNFK